MKTFEEMSAVISFLNSIDYDEFWTYACEDDISIYINMNDFFYWGTADGEDFTVDDIPKAKQAIADCRAIEIKDTCLYEVYGMDLWACRKREQLPQDPVLAKYPEVIQDLFRRTYK